MQDNSRKALSIYQRTRRYTLALLIGLICVGLLFVASDNSELVHDRIEWIGIMLILIGIGGRMWSTLFIGGHKAATVVDAGPYSMMRNPLYFFSTVAAAGVGMQTGSVTLGVIFAVLCWAAFTVVTLREERWLTANLGDPYIDYMNRVPRFFPNPRLYRDQSEVTFRPKLLNRTWLDGLVFFLAVPAFELIEYAQETGMLPVWLLLP